MSKERELLKLAIELIQIVPMMASIGKVPPDFGSELILEIQKLLSQNEAVDTQPEVSDDDYSIGFKAGSYEANMVELRDHFAGLALQGLLASPVMGDCALHDSAAEWVRELSESAYEFADEMMEVRVDS